jgi:membrane protease YdiL (CAAX protease family)
MVMTAPKSGWVQAPPEFLAASGAAERRPLRLAAFLLVATPAAIAAALLIGALLTGLAAWRLAGRRHLQLLDALGRTLDLHGGPRRLLSYGYELSVAGVGSYAAGLVVLAMAAWIFHRPTRSFLAAGGRFRWSLVGAGFLIGLAAVGLAVMAQYALGRQDIHPPLLQPGESLMSRLGYVALAAGCLYLAALAEEIVFRGVLLQITGAWTRRLLPILALNGLLFSLAHFDSDPSAFVIRMVMGAGWAWIALRTAGVEVTTGVHLANNLLVSLFVMPVSFQTPARPDRFDPAAIAVELATVALSVLGAELLVRRRRRRGVGEAGAPLAASPDPG